MGALMKYPSKKEFEKRGLKRPDFRRYFWKGGRCNILFRPRPVEIGSEEWWIWIGAVIRHKESSDRMTHRLLGKMLERLKEPSPLFGTVPKFPLASGKTCTFTRLQPLGSLPVGAETGE
jgi:hypothetical protein